MKNKIITPSFVLALAFAVSLPAARLSAQDDPDSGSSTDSAADSGSDNPTGVTGVYNGNVTTGCSYDPYTGNAMRVVDDIVVPGCVGAYPLKWTRYNNSRSGFWAFSYAYGMNATYQTSASLPDGRSLSIAGDFPPVGMEDTIGGWIAPDGHAYSAILLSDGGKIVLGDQYTYIVTYTDPVTGHQETTGSLNMDPIMVIDPYGQITHISYDIVNDQYGHPFHRRSRITEPGGRYLKINWENPSDPYNQRITSVQAFDGVPEHTTPIQWVNYTYNNNWNGTVYWVLTRADYSDGTSATYTYVGVSSVSGPRPALQTCHDVRHPGPMREIAYEYLGNGVLNKEKHINGTVVSSLAGVGGQATTLATETRGDDANAKRTFHYHVANPNPNHPPNALSGKMLDYTDFLGNTTTLTYETDYYAVHAGLIMAVTDANNHTTSYTRQNESWGIKRITFHNGDHIDQTFWPDDSEDQPYYLKSRTNERGKRTNYTRDGNNRITRKDYPADEDGVRPYETFEYNDFGQVTKHRLTNGAYQHFRYDLRGLLTDKSNPTWSATSSALDTEPKTHYDYYPSGPWMDRVYRETDPLSLITEYEYDRALVNGESTGTACAGRGLVTKTSHPDDTHKGLYPTGTYQLFAFNIYGYKVWEENELRQRTIYTYDDYGRVLTAKDPLNHTTVCTYVPTNGTNTSWQAHTANLPDTVTSPTGIVAKNVYDKNLRKISTTTAYNTGLAATTSFEYDFVGNPIKVIDPLNHATTTDYDVRNRKWHAKNALNHTTTFGYDLASNVISVQRPDSTTEIKTYDALNRMLTDTVPQDQSVSLTTSFVYNPSGTIHSVTDPKLQTTTFEYDASDVKTKMIYPNNTDYQEWTFDPAKNLIARRTANGTVQYFSYDERNRKTAMSWSNGADWAGFHYDAAGRLTEANNATSSIAREYDAAGRLTLDRQMLPPPPPVMPVTVVSRKTHGAAGIFNINLPLTGTVAVEPRSGGDHKLVLTFAHAVWYTGVSVTTGTGTIANASTSGDGTQVTLDLTGVTNAQTIVITLVGVTDGTVTNNVSVGMAVLFGDVNGNGGVTVSDVNICRSQVGIEVTTSTFLSDVNLSGGITVSDVNTIRAQVGAALPAAGPLTQTPPANHAVNVRYVCDDDGKQTRLYVDGTDYDRAFTYDVAGRFEKILNGVNGPLWFQYSYDNASNETLRHNQLNSVDQVYTRDELNRMKQRDLKRVNETLPFSKEIYRYDDLMNRLTSIDREDSKRDAFKYDFSGQLSTADYGLIYDGTHWVNPQRPVGYVWDKAGNRQSMTDTGATSNYTTTNLNQYTFAGADAVYNGTEHEISNYQGKTYGYINDERLSLITSANDSYQLAYDALGRCVRRTLNGVVSYYAYDGEKPILEYNNVYQKVAANIYGKAIDEILMRTDYSVTPNATYYCQDDHEGSVTHLTDGNGNVIESYRYDAFGAATIFNQSAIAIPQSALGNRFMFTGREYAQKFGIYEYRARAYHPGLGRFTSEDPMGYAAGDYNLFRYCGNDPEDRTDPTGLVAAPRDMDMRLPDASQTIANNELRFASYASTAVGVERAGGNLTYAMVGGGWGITRSDAKRTGLTTSPQDYHTFEAAGDAGAKQSYELVKASHPPREAGVEIGQRGDGSAHYIVTTPHFGGPQHVEDKYQKGFFQAFSPNPNNIPKGYKMVGFAYAHVWHDEKIPPADQHRAYDNGWSAVLATPPYRGGFSSRPILHHYAYPNTPDSL